jgi:hypothetical protein
MNRTSLLYLAACLAGSLTLSGCSANFSGSTVSNAAIPLGTIHGVVNGGQQPIVGASVFLYGVGISAYGGTSISILSGGNSIKDPRSGNNYVLTDANGEFNISGDYTCTPGQVLYLYSINGNPGMPSGGSYGDNAAASLMATLGTCPATGTFAGQIPYVYMNEVSTVATAFAFAPYATNATNISIGPSGSGASGPSALALQGLQNAAENAQKLFNISGSVALQGANSVTPAGNGIVPAALINTIADILAGCINSTGPSSAGCSQLFGYMPSSSNVNSGVVPTETATAAIYLAKNPGTNVSQIYGLIPTNPVFTPTLLTAPNDFTVGITYADTSLSSPNDIAIDSLGQAWITNPSSGKVTKFATSGLASSYSVPSANFLAIDTSNNVWVTSVASTPSVYELTSNGSLVGDYVTNYTLVTPSGLVNDGANTYVADAGRNVEDPYGPAGGTPTDSGGNNYIVATGLSSVQYLAADVPATAGASGYLWATSESGLVCRFFSTGGAAGCFPSSGVAKPERVALDGSSIPYIPDSSTNLLYRVGGQSGTKLTLKSGSGGGLNAPFGVAVDGNNVIWVANSGSSNSISKFVFTGGPSGTIVAQSPSTGFTSGLTGSIGHKNLAVDGSGDIWLANTSANTVTEVIGVAGPVITPLAAGAANAAIASKP